MVLKFVARNPGRMHNELVQAIREASGSPDTQVGGYLKVLIERFGLIERKLPVFAKPEAKRSRYYVTDNFLRSWLAALANPVSAIAFRPLGDLIDEADQRLAAVEGGALGETRRPALRGAKPEGDWGFSDYRIEFRDSGTSPTPRLIWWPSTKRNGRSALARANARRRKLLSDVNKFKQHVERFPAGVSEISRMDAAIRRHRDCAGRGAKGDSHRRGHHPSGFGRPDIWPLLN